MLSTDPIDLLLDETDGDLYIGPDGDGAFSTGLRAVSQGIDVALSVFRGEWFRDRNAGMPWIENDVVDAATAILGQRYDETKIRREARAAILAAAGVKSLLSLVVSFNSTTRRVDITWSVNTVFGDLTGTTEG